MKLLRQGLFSIFWLSSLFLSSCQDKVEEVASVKYDEVQRNSLDLKEGKLFREGESSPFTGFLIESYHDGERKTRVEIRDGQAHGISQGWYESGALEVEEYFEKGISHGQRTRWHENGQKKSLAEIKEGKIEGTFLRWHENGQLAQKAEMKEGKAHGLSEAWYPSGKRKALVELSEGKVVSEQFWEDH